MNTEKNFLDKEDNNIISNSINFDENHVSDKHNNFQSNIDDDKLENLKKIIMELNSKLINQKLLNKNNIKLYKIRIEKEINQTYQFSLKDFISSLFPVIDSIECAIRLFNQSDKKLHSIFERLEEVFQSLVKLLKKYGIMEISETNVPFNPDVHQAITIQPSQNINDNHVVSVMQKGYLLYDRLLRPAMVIVSKKL